MRKKQTKPPAHAPPPPKGRAKSKSRSAAGTGRKPKAEASADDNQIAALMSKSLDLAEASLTLGLNLVQRFGTTMQDQVLGRIAQAGQSFVQAATQAAQPASAGEAAASEAGAAPRSAPPGGAAFAGVTNRQPLFPGSPVRVSFSINNDSPSAAKKVAIKLDGLLGELSREKLAAANLALEPDTAAIAPMDFEKFLITGVVPMNTRSDAYQGWIVVTGEEQLRIPLRLVVTGKT